MRLKSAGEIFRSDAVQRFHDAVKDAGTPITVHMYDADHAFANPSSARYHAEAAGMAWDRTRAFLAHHLKGQPGPDAGGPG